jgi:hypothetical protein
MRIWITLATALLAIGCLSSQPAVQPWLDTQEAVALPGIVGTWLEKGEHPLRMGIGPLDPDTSNRLPLYELTFIEKGKPVRGTFALTFGRLDDTLYWDMTALPLDETDGLWDAYRLPLHSIARVALEGDTLEITPLDPDWVKAALSDGSLVTDHVLLDGDPLLTGETAELQRLVREHADEESFGAPIVFARRPARAE